MTTIRNSRTETKKKTAKERCEAGEPPSTPKTDAMSLRFQRRETYIKGLLNTSSVFAWLLGAVAFCYECFECANITIKSESKTVHWVFMSANAILVT